MPKGAGLMPPSAFNFARWLDVYSQASGSLYVKRLSGNDTLANGSHQAGPYFPKSALFDLFPGLNRPRTPNPRVAFDLHVDSHGGHTLAKAIWYNNKRSGGTRDEVRITTLGGKSSALLDPDNTGAIAVFAFLQEGSRTSCRVWVCRSADEEDHFENRVGPVDPAKIIMWRALYAYYPTMHSGVRKKKTSASLGVKDLPTRWRKEYPSPADIVAKTQDLCPTSSFPDPDRRLVERRETEFELFLSVENAIELPKIRRGFQNLEEFVGKAQSILQRRKARSGLSLELQTRALFVEEGLESEKNFTFQPKSEDSKQPDFLFPSEAAYKDRNFPADSLRMLAVKTTCRDRWRQILAEADRVQCKHLLTLQEGISVGQFQEMVKANVKLVVPKPLVTKYHRDIRGRLLSVRDFISEVSGIDHSAPAR